jgi:hypothetical protein
MDAHDLGALVLFAGANIRYVTSSYQGNWKYNINIRYAVLPNGGEPVLFETAGSDMQCAKIDMPWMEGRIKPAMTWCLTWRGKWLIPWWRSWRKTA